jgi:hypothetical protein
LAGAPKSGKDARLRVMAWLHIPNFDKPSPCPNATGNRGIDYMIAEHETTVTQADTTIESMNYG